MAANRKDRKPTQAKAGRGAAESQQRDEVSPYAQNDYSGTMLGDGAKTRPVGVAPHSSGQNASTGTGGVGGGSQGSHGGGYESASTRDEDYDSGKPNKTNKA